MLTLHILSSNAQICSSLLRVVIRAIGAAESLFCLRRLVASTVFEIELL